MNTSRHLVSPLAAAVAAVAVAAFLIGRGDYVRGAFHTDILASVDQSEVLSPEDMVPEEPAPAGTDRTLTSSVR